MRSTSKAGFCAVALITAFVANSYAADSLPQKLSGRWDGTNQGGQQMNFEVFVAIDKQDPDGTVSGTLTRFGMSCGAKDEPFKGTFDGTALSFRSLSRPNVNSRRPNGTSCGEDEYSLKRSADGKSFEGTIGGAGQASFHISLTP